jgi:RHS repeat-associated protein
LFVYPQGQVSGSTSYFYTRDHLGSIREMRSTGKKGAIVARFDYDPYGRSTSVINNTLPDFNFTGLYRHSVSNLDFAVYRAYDSDLGRWLSRDPLPGAELSQGSNLYAYVKNRVINSLDPSGENLCDADENCRGASDISDEEANKRIRDSNKLLDDWMKNYFGAFFNVGGMCKRAAQEGKYLIDIAIADAKRAIRKKAEEDLERRICPPPAEPQCKK